MKSIVTIFCLSLGVAACGGGSQPTTEAETQQQDISSVQVEEHQRAGTATSTRTSPELSAANTESKALILPDVDPEIDDHVMIFSETPTIVQNKSGIVRVHISTFTPMQTVVINGAELERPQNPYSVTYRVPYEIQDDNTTLAVEVNTVWSQVNKDIVVSLLQQSQ